MSTSPRGTRLVLYSKLAFYPSHWLALEEIARRYRADAVVLAAPRPEVPSVHAAHGTPNPAPGLPIDVRHMPRGSRATRLGWLARELKRIDPDVIWVQENPTDPFLLEMLALYRFRQRPRIVSAVSATIFARPPALERAAQRLLWPRLDGVIAVATPSVEGIRAAGLPESVPTWSLVAGALEPAAEVVPRPLPFESGEHDFVAGFSGRLVEEKGWRVLIEALRRLPKEFRLVVAGDGPQVGEITRLADSAELRERLFFVGLLPKSELWGFYAALDCLVVPSLTAPRWMESFGGVLTDAMVMGLPIVGSSSGSIPEVMGAAGIVVPEGDVAALASALVELRADPELCVRLGDAGRKRFRAEFAIPRYADKIAAALGLEPLHLASAV